MGNYDDADYDLIATVYSDGYSTSMKKINDFLASMVSEEQILNRRIENFRVQNPEWADAPREWVAEALNV